MERKTIKKIVQVQGMTCVNCENRIEKALKKLEGIIEVKAIYSSSNVYITYDTNVVSMEKIYDALEKIDYPVLSQDIGKNSAKLTQQTKTQDGKFTVNDLINIGVILLGLYVIINHTVGFNYIPEVTQNMGYGILFVVGLMTSVHCIAMCGGINLSQCMSYKMDQGETKKSNTIKPSLLYNAGRVVSYTIIGGVVGALGSVISFTGVGQGIVAVISGVFMVIMGINMLNIFPWLRKLNPRMPRIFRNKINSSSKKGPFYVGILNGLMPCGPLQAMQLYALGTGSLFAGAISMFMFSLGTVPLMFGFGAISTLLSSKFTNKMLKVSAALVIVLGFVMLNRGFALSGINTNIASNKSAAITSNSQTAPAATASPASSSAATQKDVQVIKSKITSGGYPPIVVEKGIPVKWIISANQSDLTGCNNKLNIPQYGIKNFQLKAGENIIEFNPDKEGKYAYSCWMGMIRSTITVEAK